MAIQFTTQIRSVLGTYRGSIAVMTATLALGGSLALVAGSGDRGLTTGAPAPSGPPVSVQKLAQPPVQVLAPDQAQVHAQGLVENRPSATKPLTSGEPEELALDLKINHEKVDIQPTGPERAGPERTGEEPFFMPQPIKEVRHVEPLRLEGLAQSATDARLAPRVARRDLKVRSGDTLEKLLERAGAERQQAFYATRSLASVHDARSLNVGQAVQVTLEYPVEPSAFDPALDVYGDAPVLKSVSIETKVDEEVFAVRQDDGNYHAAKVTAELDIGFALKGGTISTSLYEAALEAQIPDSIIINLIALYSYDIDFQREIRQGDEFELLFERYYDETGRALKSGNIEFASMTVQGRQKGYFRFKTTDDGITDYYDAKGQSAKKFLMRTPINGARISSGFGRRKHPVLGYTKQHMGTDFAAPTGTPIFAAGNGVIERSSRYGSYGNYVRIRHANGYKTAYAHMSRYGRGIKQGRRVKQGQIIGYVGATGRVTGAHLHYEVMKNGSKVNPLRIKVPTGRKLGGNMLTAFRIERDRINEERAAQGTWRAGAMVAETEIGRVDG